MLSVQLLIRSSMMAHADMAPKALRPCCRRGLFANRINCRPTVVRKFIKPAYV